MRVFAREVSRNHSPSRSAFSPPAAKMCPRCTRLRPMWRVRRRRMLRVSREIVPSMPAHIEQELTLTYHTNVESVVRVCAVVTINCPLHPETEPMFDDTLIRAAQASQHRRATPLGTAKSWSAGLKAVPSGSNTRLSMAGSWRGWAHSYSPGNATDRWRGRSESMHARPGRRGASLKG